jgi:5-methylcytosine-specific restriction endonuclease McrA
MDKITLKARRIRFRSKIYQTGKYKDIFTRDNYICFYCGIKVYSLDHIYHEVDDEKNKWHMKLINKKISYNKYIKLSDTKILFDKYYKTHKLDLATIDHIIPLRLEENNTFENLVTSCKSCNSKKGGKYDR